MLCIGIVTASLGLLLLVGNDRNFQLPPRHERRRPATPYRPRGEELLG
ncbi:hypothetical protein JJL56_18675 [Azospirillum sp. YIM DDC1]|uniref:Uncharacterized protein n=1 Tax=Azospirillum aestuarii TaxID=2802052 RepID=A0ABS1I2M9_9PROT|nr:hypothetical protein [Azospirillum aestuarii]MBK4720893.1 hypothetical protein [Azospirillum aestuarii]